MVKNIDIGAPGLGFDAQPGQIGHGVANSLLPLRNFFGAMLALSRNGPAAHYTFGSNTARIRKTRFFFFKRLAIVAENFN